VAHKFESAAAFRNSLEERLKRMADERAVPINALRQRVLMERLLARLFARRDVPWLLKGGYALELALRPRARTTRDIDLTVPEGASPTGIADIREALQQAAELDAGDFLRFQLGAPMRELAGAPLGGARFPVVATMAGRPFGQFHLDVGVGDPLIGEPEQEVGDALLEFAGIAPPTVWTIPKALQFAEKVHAYVVPRGSRENSRTKDLIDMLLLIETGRLEAGAVRRSIEGVFASRSTPPLPRELPPPPPTWAADFELLAREVELRTRDLGTGFRIVEQYWYDLGLGGRTG
jgi:hypothetical protein